MKLSFLVQCDNIIVNSEAVSFQFHRYTVGSLGLFLQLQERKMSREIRRQSLSIAFHSNCSLFMLFLNQL